MSRPSFTYDVAEAFGEFVNEQSYQFAATGQAAYSLVASEGGKEPLLAQMSDFSMGSDHEVYAEGSWRIPAIYLNDWPDRYIHTNMDVAANIDPTKLKRAAFIGAASGYFLARLSNGNWPAIAQVLDSSFIRRTSVAMQRSATLQPIESQILLKSQIESYDLVRGSSVRFGASLAEPGKMLTRSSRLIAEYLGGTHFGFDPGPWTGDAALKFSRVSKPSGPMAVFGYDYFTDKYGEEKARSLKLLSYQGLRGSGEEYAYEVLNFVDGVRNAQQIRDAVSAEYGPVPLEYVLEYLRALESIGVIQRAKM